jgi:hypothetical protein
MGPVPLTSTDASLLARKVYECTRVRGSKRAIFVDAFGKPFFTSGAGPKFESNAFRYPHGLVGVYDQRATPEQIEADIVEVQQGRSVGT